MPVPPEISRLYDLADELYSLAPWELMEETDLIAMRLPGANELFYASVMGRNGEHRALALYLGEDALEKFNSVQKGVGCTQEDLMRLVLESRQLQLSFNERRGMEKSDLQTIKALGRKYRGDNWPAFKSFHPGWEPGPLNHEEIAWLTVACEQLLVVAGRLEEAGGSTFLNGPKGLQILCREPQAEGVWKDVWLPFKIVAHEYPSPLCNEILAAKVRKHPLKVRLECAFSMLPSPIGPRYGKRTYPYLVVVVDADTGFVFGMDLLSVEPQPFEALIDSVPDRFLAIFDKARVRPMAIDCASIATCELLASISAALKIKVQCVVRVPMVDELMKSMPI